MGGLVMVRPPLMVIYDLDVRGSGCALRPFKANPPPYVDADAELSDAFPLQGLKTVAWQGLQVGQARCGVQNFQPLIALPLESLELPDKLSYRERFRPFVPVTQNHASS